MKQKSTTRDLLFALIAGEKLTGMYCAKRFGTSKATNRFCEFEKKYDITLKRKWVKGDNKNGNHYACYAYSMKREDAKRVKKLLQVKK